MSSQPPPAADNRRLRGLLLVALVLLLMLLWTLLSWSPDGARAVDRPAPGPTVTVTATPPAAPTTAPTAAPDPTAAPTGPSDGTASGTGGARVTTPEGRTFTLTAAVTSPLLPGRPGTLRVLAANSEPVGLRLTGVTVTVLPPTAAGCEPSWLQITPWTGDVALPASGTATVDLAALLLDLPDVDQSGCRGGTFPLQLSGSGREAP